MLRIYGSPLSSPTNKVRYAANLLRIPYEFQHINLGTGEHRQPEYLKINPLGKVPAIDEDGFKLAESNAIIRYLAEKQQSSLYPRDLQQRAVVDQWMDYASQHIALMTSRIMWNTYFYKIVNHPADERAIQDSRQFLAQYLPNFEKQLTQTSYVASNQISLADIALLAALDVAELAAIDLSAYPHLHEWRKKLMKETFYTDCHPDYTTAFKKILGDKLS